MPLNDTILNVGAAAMAAAMTHAAIHTATPNSSGSNPAASARQTIDWATPSGGDLSLDAALDFTGGAASGAATHVGFWSASSGGTFYGYLALTGDQTFNDDGEYRITAITIPGSAT
jgi:hypothetical protein